MDAERWTKGAPLVPATALCCRVCETRYGLDPIGVCSKCFGPLDPGSAREGPPAPRDPVYDRDAQRAVIPRERIEAGPRSIWRYADLLPVAPPPEQRLAPGCT